MLFFFFIVVSMPGRASCLPASPRDEQKIEIGGARLGQLHCSCTSVISRCRVKHTTTSYPQQVVVFPFPVLACQRIAERQTRLRDYTYLFSPGDVCSHLG